VSYRTRRAVPILNSAVRVASLAGHETGAPLPQQPKTVFRSSRDNHVTIHVGNMESPFLPRSNRSNSTQIRVRTAPLLSHTPPQVPSHRVLRKDVNDYRGFLGRQRRMAMQTVVTGFGSCRYPLRGLCEGSCTARRGLTALCILLVETVKNHIGLFDELFLTNACLFRLGLC
jgi:hypothetical protein